jgi:7-cyano-7-deazaguanine synthase
MLSAGLSELLLLSGGIDSACLAYQRRPRAALTIDYGQITAYSEVRSAAQICKELAIEHALLTVDLRSIGSGVMTGGDAATNAPTPEWWPYRNQLLISLGAAKAIALGCTRVVIGTVKGDGIHADGRPEFIEAMRRTLSLQEGAIDLQAPAIDLEPAALLRAWTFSCHIASEPCGQCRGCYKHLATIEAVFGL